MCVCLTEFEIMRLENSRVLWPESNEARAKIKFAGFSAPNWFVRWRALCLAWYIRAIGIAKVPVIIHGQVSFSLVIFLDGEEK